MIFVTTIKLACKLVNQFQRKLFTLKLMNSPPFVASTITYYQMGVVNKFFHVTNILPNIAYFVGVVTKFIIIPRKAHLEVVIFIFLYLKRSLDFALHY